MQDGFQHSFQHILENGQRRPPKNKVDIFDAEKEKLIRQCNQLKESSLRYRLEGVSKIWDFCRYFKVNFKVDLVVSLG